MDDFLTTKPDTGFVFVPLLRFKPFPGFDQFWTQALGPQAADAIRLAGIVRSAAPDEASFQRYMLILKTMGTGRLVSQWMNCFKPLEYVTGQDARVEYLTTVWNYMSLCHSQILACDETVKEGQVKIKELLETSQALVNIYKYVIGNLEHPIFTVKHGDFLQAYQDYIVSLWQFSVALHSSKVARKAVAKSALRCLEQANVMERSLHFCTGQFKDYFKVLTEMARKYFRGYSHYLMGLQKMNEKNYGEAIAWFQEGDAQIGAVKADLTVAGEMVTAVRNLRETLKAKASEARQVNVKYDATPIPDRVDIETLGAPQDLFQIKASPKLAQFYGGQVAPSTPAPAQGTTQAHEGGGSAAPPSGAPVFHESSKPPVFTPGSKPSRVPSAPVVHTPSFGTDPDPSSLTASGPHKPTSTPGGPPVFTPTTGAPPAFTPTSGGPPVFTPTTGAPPAFTPTSDAPKPVDDDPSAEIPWLHELNGCVADMVSDDSFPMWGIVRSMKEGVVKKIGDLHKKLPKMTTVLGQYAGRIQDATKNDRFIQDLINQYKGNPSQEIRQNIDTMLERAAGFYNELELRLEKLGGVA